MNTRFAIVLLAALLALAEPAAAQTTPTASPSPAPSATVSSAASAVPSPVPSETPVPAVIKAPPGWTQIRGPVQTGSMKTDHFWRSRKGILVAAHLEMASAGAPLVISQIAPAFQVGLQTIAGPKGITASKAVKICNGKQDGWFYTAKIAAGTTHVIEEITLAAGDRVYVSEYVRSASAKEDRAAKAAIMSLCAPGAP